MENIKGLWDGELGTDGERREYFLNSFMNKTKTQKKMESTALAQMGVVKSLSKLKSQT